MHAHHGMHKRDKQKGATVLMVSHDMEIVQDFAREVMVLNDGELLAHGSTKDILRDGPLLASASLLPPQITELALRLGEGYENVVTVMTWYRLLRKREEVQSDGRLP
jgi:ABC-type cobalt transport system, ATPase component